MNLDYKTTTKHPDKLTTLHIIVIDGEILTTTRAKEVLQFAKNRSITKRDYKELKKAVGNEEKLTITD